MRFAFALLLASVACNSSRSEPTNGAAARSEPVNTAAIPPAESQASGDPVELISTAEGDGASAAAVAGRYIRALVTHDWTAVCSTRAKREREEMARMGGSCEQAFSAILGEQPLELFEDIKVGGARRRGQIIAVDLVQPGQTKPALTLLLEREGSDWVLVDLPADQSF